MFTHTSLLSVLRRYKGSGERLGRTQNEMDAA